MFRSGGIGCRHGRDRVPAALAQRGPRCRGHPRLGCRSPDVDARDKPAHDGDTNEGNQPQSE